MNAGILEKGGAMKSVSWSALVLVAMQLTVFSANGKKADSYIVPKSNGTPVYADRLQRNNETAIFRIDRSDRCRVTGESRRRYAIKTVSGRSGWIEKKSVTAIDASKHFVFDNADVLARLDDPSPIYIIDADAPDTTGIELDRSFSNELRRNVDRFTLERQVAAIPGPRRFHF